MKKFIVAITEHRSLGYILSPYLVDSSGGNPFITIIKRVSVQNIDDDSFEYSVNENKIIGLIDKYSDKNLLRKFDKGGNLNNFYSILKPDILYKKVVPFVEQHIVECLNVLKGADIPLYRKEAKYNNLYDVDLIELCYKNTEAIFNFERTDSDTRYFLSLSYENKEIKIQNRRGILLTNSPCRFLYQNRLYYFNDIEGKKLLPFFEKEYVSIPIGFEDKYYNTFVYNAVKNSKVKAKGFDIVDINPSKNAILSLEQNLLLKPVFVLKFRYNNHILLSDRKNENIVSLEKDNGRFIFYRFKRDAGWEEKQKELLTELGLTRENNTYGIFNSLDSPNEKSFRDTIDWLVENRKKLLELGISVSQEKLEKRFFTGKRELEIDVKKSSDWFDVYAVVKFGEFSFPFVKLKKYILNDIHEFVLPNGETVVLPEEWFAKFRDIFNLAVPSSRKYDLRLNKHHIGLLNTNFIGISEKYSEDYEKLMSIKKEMPEIPEGINAELRNYQKEGFGWMNQLHDFGFGGCLADDMGLGKTLQTITLLLNYKRKSVSNSINCNTKILDQPSLFDNSNSAEPEIQPASLIVMPTSLVHNWEYEIKKFAPRLKTFRYIGSKRKQITNLEGVINYYDVIITTYGTIRNDSKILANHEFYYLILDEGQYIKNPGSKIYNSVTALNAKYRLVLTGTPIENSISDLWAQINFLNRGLLGNMAWFKREFIIPIEKKNSYEAQEKLQKLIRPFILRRKKEDVARDLPPITEQIRVIVMEKEQKKLYDKEKSTVRNAILSEIEEKGKGKAAIKILKGLTRLRQIANHPELIDESKFKFESGKFNEILRMLRILVDENHKILLFSSFVSQLDLFAREFKKRDWGYTMLTGKTVDRKKVIDQFQKNPNTNIFLISLKAGGVGLNLTSADYVFIVDPWWNPASEMQAINRAHRIGQDKNVFVYQFISKDSIEEKIQILKERKLKLSDKFINSNNPFLSITEDELLKLFDDNIQ
jgi:SNF2 family DNA or RNA helicase